MTSLLVILYGFLGLFFAVTGYCVARTLDTRESESATTDFPVAEPTPAT